MIKKTFLKKILCGLGIGSILFFSTSCGKDLSGILSTWLKFSSFSWSLPSGVIPGLKFCLKRTRLKGSGEDTDSDRTKDSDNTSLDKEVDLQESGSTISSIDKETGDYARIEFDLEDSCGKGYSVKITNANGTYQTSDSIELIFNGTFSLKTSGASLLLQIQNLINTLKSVTSDAELSTTLQNITLDDSITEVE